MPFGLHEAAATFQRLVDRALEGCESFARAYIDDIIVSCRTWKEHLQHLRQVLQALDRAGLRANPQKSKLGFQELKYLGYLIGKGCLKPLPDKVLLLEHHPRPVMKKHLRQFLGFVGYYSRFIPDFASLAGALTDCLTKTAPDPIQWTASSKAAFNSLRKSLSGSPVLHNPDFSRPFELATDASGTGLGAVLSQHIGNTRCPVLFISRKLSLAEQKYSTVEKEALAVKWAVGALYYYLLHNPFILVVDHAPLKWLETMKDHNARVLRWYLSLLLFFFTVHHWPGSQHGDADYMSR